MLARSSFEINRSVSKVLWAVALLFAITLLTQLNQSSARALSLSNGQGAVNMIGQYENELADPLVPSYVKAYDDNGPNVLGIGGAVDIAMDTVHHRLFIADNNSGRIIIHNLDESNELIDYVPDNVLGQSNYYDRYNDEDPTDSNLSFGLNSITYDPDNNLLFAADIYFNRVMVYDVASISNGESAVYVLGQPDFTSSSSDTTASSLSSPSHVRYYRDGVTSYIFVADTENHRALVYDVTTITNGEDAAYVYGQEDMLSNVPEPGADSLVFPTALAIDSANEKLYVGQSLLSRVFVFDISTLASGADATSVLGQPSFISEDDPDLDINSFGEMVNGLALNASNTHLFVSDSENHRMMVFDVTSIIDGEDAVNVLGQADFDTGIYTFGASAVNEPMGATIVGNKLYLADLTHDRISIFDITSVSDNESAIDAIGQYSDETETPLVPNFAKNGNDNAQNRLGMDYPVAIEFDPIRHLLFVAEEHNDRIIIHQLNGANELIDYIPDYVIGKPDFVSSASNDDEGVSEELTASNIANVSDIALDYENGRLFVTDADFARVLVFDITTITNGEDAVNVIGAEDFATYGYDDGSNVDTIYEPEGIDYEPTEQLLYVTDQQYNRVMVFNVSSITNGEDAVAVLGQEDFSGSTSDESADGMEEPLGVLIDDDNDRLFVADTYNNRILVFDVATITSGEDAINVLGQENFDDDGSDTAIDGLDLPRGMTLSPDGDQLFVAEEENSRVIWYDITAITNGEDAVGVLGQDNFDNKEEVATQTSLYQPHGLSFDPAGRFLYVGDSGNDRVMIYTAENGDSDADGIPDSQENSGPSSGDANDDGILDRLQSNVVSFMNSVSSSYTVLEVNSDCAIESSSVESESSLGVHDGGYDYSAGFINFNALCTTGSTATVSVYQYDSDSNNLVVRKYKATNNSYTTITDVTMSDLTVDGQAVTKAVYSVIDGGTLDDDGLANGTIVDPVGFGNSAVGSPNTGVHQTDLLRQFNILWPSIDI